MLFAFDRFSGNLKTPITRRPTGQKNRSASDVDKRLLIIMDNQFINLTLLDEQNFDLLLRFGDGKVGYFELTGLSPSILSGGNQISLKLEAPENICDSLYPIRHVISLNFLTIEAGNTSDVQTVPVSMNCSMTIQ